MLLAIFHAFVIGNLGQRGRIGILLQLIKGRISRKPLLFKHTAWGAAMGVAHPDAIVPVVALTKAFLHAIEILSRLGVE